MKADSELIKPSDLVTVALVRPKYAFNVGQCARAMGNLGFTKLALVEAEAIQDVNDLDVRQGAARGQLALQQANRYESVSELVAKTDGNPLVVAFSRRPGSIRQTVYFHHWLSERTSESFSRPTILLFGSEDRGLENHDLEFANFILELPTWGEHGSYNLSHSVLLALYMLQTRWTEMGLQIVQKNFSLAMSSKTFPESIIKEWLQTLKMPFDDRKQSAYVTLKNLLLRNEMTEKEFGVLEAVLFQTVRKLKDRDGNSIL